MTKGLPGAAFHKASGKWQSRIMLDGERKHLGYYDSEDEAHAAYLKAKDAAPVVKSGGSQSRKADTTDYAGLRDLFGSEFMGCYDFYLDTDKCRGVLAGQLVRLTRALNVSPYYVSQVMFWNKGEEYDSDTCFVLPDETIIARVETLRVLDLWEHVDDIVLAMDKEKLSFEQAVSRHCDLV